MGVAIELDRAGLHDQLIVEAGSGFGGTWYWNRYPGVAVDIPSFSYQFSFEQRPDWSRVYARGDELLRYAEHCAERYGLHERTRFGTTVTGAEFDEAHHVWRVTTDAGDTLIARHVVDATGALTKPELPDIPGVGDFAGVTMHTARWDPSQDLTGRRVAVIGTGASAVQLIPSIAPQVEHLTVFQRTPIWCLPKPDAALPGPVGTALSRIPGAQRLARLASQAFVEVTFPFAAHFHATVPLASVFERFARRYVRKQVDDPALVEKLTPRYAIGCKRPSFHNSYLATFNRPDVALETTPIERITPRGVVCADGTEHPVDVLVLATGFKVFDRGNFPKYPVAGRGGEDLEAWWDVNRYQAYEGLTVPGFPNLFMVFGPYGYNGASYFTLIETQARHIVRCLLNARRRGATAVEVTEAANARFFAEMLARRTRQVFWQSSCSLANSYYFDRHGDAPLRPSTTLEARWRAGRFPLDDYRWQTAAGPDRDPQLAADGSSSIA
ncbi:NAD(P)/FAD-dependent oxidoreductase [Thermoleophilia bacterium SCSIO 60948]|nr:NAD(P)/FAD-dependent oxidoreductase [Thermoleophilia bacterium SCSIO 60948]